MERMNGNLFQLNTPESNEIDTLNFTQISEGKKARTNSLIELQVSWEEEHSIEHLILSVT